MKSVYIYIYVTSKMKEFYAPRENLLHNYRKREVGKQRFSQSAIIQIRMDNDTHAL